MSRRHATAATLLLVVLTLLPGCTTGADRDPPAEDPPADGEVAENQAAEDTSAEDRRPEVPLLHPEIDDLDEAIVRITTTADDEVELDVKVAETDTARRRGLMEVMQLPEGTGMLFLFDEERTSGFWMWNTLIELDIAFAAADGEIVAVETMVPCETSRADCPVTAPGEPYVTVLEVAGGNLADAGVTPGAHLTWSDPVPAG